MSIPTNSHGLLIFKRTARPVGIPPELLALPRDSQIEYDNSLGEISGPVVCPASECLDQLTSTIEQQANGFFTIDEAAQILTAARGGDAKRWRAELWREIRKEKLEILEADIHRQVHSLKTVREYTHLLRATDIVAAGIDFPVHADAVPVPPAAARVVTHSIKTRRHALMPVVELAQSQCLNPHDSAEVWGKLSVLANNKEAPFLRTEEDGLAYLHKGEVKIFTRDALGKRLKRYRQ